MFLAINSQSEKIEPAPARIGICPGCQKEVYAKCGQVNVWHWAHKKNESCDPFSEPETEWHRKWKEIFGKEYSEIILRKNEKWHFADIFTKDKIVIELQHSPLKMLSILEREEFYGERMLWILDGIRYGKNVSANGLGLLPDSFYSAFVKGEQSGEREFKNIKVDLKRKRCPPEIENQMKSIGMTYSPTNKIFYKNGSAPLEKLIELQRMLNVFAAKVNGESDIYGKDYIYNKDWPSRGWKNAKRHIFIDYRVGVLMKISNGMGTKTGMARFIRTNDFISKYTGRSSTPDAASTENG